MTNGVFFLVKNSSIDLRLLCELPKLCDVNLSHCTHLQDESVSTLAKRLPRLRKFNIDGIANISDG